VGTSRPLRVRQRLRLLVIILNDDSASKVLSRRESAIIATTLAAVALLSWGYTVMLASYMMDPDADMSEMPGMGPWSVMDFAFMLVMWIVMMVAMMIPSAIPAILTYASVLRGRAADIRLGGATAAFLSGYLATWTVFSFAVTLLQWVLHAAALLSPMMMKLNPALGGAVLVLAGAYQFTSVKHVCLSRCRTPLGFMINEWRDGPRGAFTMGLRYGRYCIGCCWLLMALLFVVGVMNILWIAGLAIVVLVEKLLPAGEWLSRGIGMGACLWGVWLLWMSA
jgi:predicted metal-binding membrane protein